MTELAVNRSLDYAQGVYLDEIIPQIIGDVGSEHHFGYVPISPEGTTREDAPYATTVIPGRSTAELISTGVEHARVTELLEMDVAGNVPLVVNFGNVRLYSLHPDRFYTFDTVVTDHAQESGIAIERIPRVEKVAINLTSLLPQHVAPAALTALMQSKNIHYFRENLADFERIWVVPNRKAESVVKDDAIKIVRILREEMPAILFHKAEFGSDTNVMIAAQG